MSTMQQPDVMVVLTSMAATEVRKFMEAEGVTPEQGGLRVSVMPGGCSGFKYGLVIEDKNAEDDTIFELEGIKLFVDPFSAQYLSGTTIDYVTSMQSGDPIRTPRSLYRSAEKFGIQLGWRKKHIAPVSARVCPGSVVFSGNDMSIICFR
jgi:iron-sulfur cluster assembly protein